MLDDLEFVLCDAICDCYIYLLKVFLSFAATICLLVDFSISTAYLYNLRASLDSACIHLVLWIFILVEMRIGASIKGLLYGIPGDTY